MVVPQVAGDELGHDGLTRAGVLWLVNTVSHLVAAGRVVHHDPRHEGELVVEQVGRRSSSLQCLASQHGLHHEAVLLYVS